VGGLVKTGIKTATEDIIPSLASGLKSGANRVQNVTTKIHAKEAREGAKVENIGKYGLFGKPAETLEYAKGQIKNLAGQLKKKLESTIPNLSVDLKIIAQTGWTTSNLIQAIKEQQPTPDYKLVTLLIGVNNQYQNKEFSIYGSEFPQLVQTAITLAKGNKNNVIVVSIPDYSYTPFGQRSANPTQISTEIDRYNAFAKSYCDSNGIAFINITDITRQGLTDPNLVATDGLHPSEKAYSLFVDRIVTTLARHAVWDLLTQIWRILLCNLYISTNYDEFVLACCVKNKSYDNL
jgi:lysophospholipase L1-like esterase